MSELIKNADERKKELRYIITHLDSENDIPKMKKRFSKLLANLSPEEIAEAEQALIAEGVPVEEVQKLCEIHVEAFKDGLQTANHQKVLSGHPVDTYKRENIALKKLMRSFRQVSKKIPAGSDLSNIREVFDRIAEIDIHYTRKENQLFPFLEGVGFTGPSKVMWGKHDEIRASIKLFRRSLEAGNIAEIKLVGKDLLRKLKKMIFMEEKILFPTALRKLPESAWFKIREGELDIGYAWVQPGSVWAVDVQKAVSPVELSGVQSSSEKTTDSTIDLRVGALTSDQLNLMLNNLPVDVSFVDENDEVRYYNEGQERIFPRSPGIIGRKVQNCHPPKSVHIVQKIVDDFHNGHKEPAEFWLSLGGKFIHIRYFPLFTPEGAYKGVLEVSQDVSGIRALEGEKRLM
ncbi:MAG: DUF438 domain-containing protein [Bacteroidetes bacterium]|nr:DUF438 domain-containing protein [Bacteroidota bacterium]